MILLASAGEPGVSYGEAVLLGFVQGVTEFLPISSTAHLKIIPVLCGYGDPGAAFSAVIQLGTVLAIIVYFAKDLLKLGAGSVRALRGDASASADLRAMIGIALGTIPVAALGFLFQSKIKHELRSLWVMAAMIGLFGVLLAIADRVAARGTRKSSDLTIRDALLVGVAQSFALLPGASRSGTTLTGAFFLGLERATAARFSFLLSIPAVTAAGLYELVKERAELKNAGVGPLVVATLVSAVVGYASIEVLLRYLRTRSAMPFVVYRVVLAGFLVIALMQGRLSPG